jgi:hypothetical protein
VKRTSEAKNSLVLEIRGGLGNQLFQLAGAISQAKRLGAGLIVNETALYRHSDYTRQNWVKHLELDQLSSGTDIRWIMDTKLMTYFNKRKRIQVDEETIVSLKSLTGDLQFRGWFQESRFPLSLNIAKSSLQPISTSDEVNLHIENVVNSTKLCGIHMRFGDFIETSWGVIPSEWYTKVLKELKGSGIEELHIYSDDVEMARQMIECVPHGFKIVFPEQTGTFLPHELFWILRHYQNFVSSNSTLSWWASFLNVSQNPRIYCKWDNHLFLDPWTRLN